MQIESECVTTGDKGGQTKCSVAQWPPKGLADNELADGTPIRELSPPHTANGGQNPLGEECQEEDKPQPCSLSPPPAANGGQASPGEEYQEEDLPEACSTCMGLRFWFNPFGDSFCMTCKPPIQSQKLLRLKQHFQPQEFFRLMSCSMSGKTGARSPAGNQGRPGASVKTYEPHSRKSKNRGAGKMARG